MIVCKSCHTRHINLKLARGKSQKCGGVKADNSICHQTLMHRDNVVDA
jgi:hypothetical protein